MTKQGGTGIDILKYIPPDKGCSLAESCLNCPFPECVLDKPDGRRKLIKNHRDAEILKLWHQGKTQKELASIFGLAVGTINRAIARGKKSPDA